MTNEKWIHAGSGPHYMEGWLNFDMNTWEAWEKQPDVLCSIYDMPFKTGQAEKFYCGHILEHLVWETVPDALLEVKRVMAPGGVLCVVGPCMDKAIATGQPQWLLDEIPAGWNGEGVPDGFAHRWTATTALTRKALETTFDAEKILEVPITAVHLPHWPNTAPSIPPVCGMWQCAFLVTR